MKRIGILGGTFNPVHLGHLVIAQAALEQLKLNKVLFIPSNLPPHKQAKNVISPRHRYQMVSLAIKGNPAFEAVDFEIKRKGKSYSIDTIKYLKDKYPKGTKFYFIIGGDMVAGLKRWKQVDELMKLVKFVVANRQGYKKIKSVYKLRYLTTLDFGISSSYIRKHLKSRHTVKYLLPESVHHYIQKRKLYSDT